MKQQNNTERGNTRKLRDFDELDPVHQIALDAQILARNMTEVFDSLRRAEADIQRHRRMQDERFQREYKRGGDPVEAENEQRELQRLTSERDLAQQVFDQWCGEARALYFRIVMHCPDWLDGLTEINHIQPGSTFDRNTARDEWNRIMAVADHELQTQRGSAGNEKLPAEHPQQDLDRLIDAKIRSHLNLTDDALVQAYIDNGSLSSAAVALEAQGVDGTVPAIRSRIDRAIKRRYGSIDALRRDRDSGTLDDVR